ncbi:MAG TPA: multicopper oxidase family protein [Bauldia sp.]|nr:multicopper oxidase family protein [Bauldia sp.]
MLTVTRRRFMAGAGCVALGAAGLVGAASATGPALPQSAEPGAGRTVPLRLIAAERPQVLPCFGGHTLPMWTLSDATWLPVVRVNLGDRLDVAFENRLPVAGEHSSIHWHGIRLPNDQDGVPYLVQPPVEPGGSFRYVFTPPDTGTFFFHTHCNTAEQLGRGLMGILIVEGDAPEPYAADEVVLLRDWRIDSDTGGFASFTTKRGASRAGTYGNVRSGNGAPAAELRLPASSDCRLRVINGDPTRIMEVTVEGTEAAVIAIDGIAVPPFPLDGWLLAPAMRVDLAVRAPAAGDIAYLIDRRGEEPLRLAHLIGDGTPRPEAAFEPRPLRAGRIPEPDLAVAEIHAFDFAAGPGGMPVVDPGLGPAVGSICLASDDFWTINGTAWPGRDHARIPPPLAVLELGSSYRFLLRNLSKIAHPIHIHGHSFKVLGSNRRTLAIHHADTVLLLPEETVEVAFVADNPGDWMFHCHVIEHQETGMMAYLRVA